MLADGVVFNVESYNSVVKVIYPLICLVCVVVGFGLGGFWRDVQDVVKPPPEGEFASLPPRHFDRSAWLGTHSDHVREVAARGAMSEDVAKRFKPGTPLLGVLTDLGCPDRLEFRRDVPPESELYKAFGPKGVFSAEYFAGWIPSGPGDWYPSTVSFVFSGDEKLLAFGRDLIGTH